MITQEILPPLKSAQTVNFMAHRRQPPAAPPSSDDDDADILIDDGLDWLVAQTKGSSSQEVRSKRRDASLECTVVAFLARVGYHLQPTHWRYGRKTNLCAYLATLLTRGEITEAEAEQPTAGVAQRVVEERQGVFALLRGEEDAVDSAFVAYAMEPTYRLDGRAGRCERQVRDAEWLLAEEAAQVRERAAHATLVYSVPGGDTEPRPRLRTEPRPCARAHRRWPRSLSCVGWRGAPAASCWSWRTTRGRRASRSWPIIRG